MSGNLGHIAATVSLNIDPFKASARVLNSTIKATTAELKAQELALKGNEKSVSGMRNVYSTMSRQLDNYKSKLTQQKKTYDDARASLEKHAKAADIDGANMDKLKTRVANAAAAYNRTSAQAEVLQQKMFQLNKEANFQDSAWQKVGAGAMAVSKAFGFAGDKLTAFGSKATTRVTLPIVTGFGAATKAAIDFDSQIAAMGPLLTNGGKVTAEFQKQLDQLSAASKNWAMQYGVSTAAINDGMSEMIKRGYTAAQTLGAMPAVLDATKASGDDFNDVMHVSTSVLEQFGLKSESTSEMLKNTSRVTDTLTYVANATAAGFNDMGEAMTYVGPTAHAAGISLEQTAAAIGIMSNRGIEGSVAGTTLRSSLTRLLNPSKQNVEGFKKLGISVGDFKKGTLGLPEIIDKIKNNTKGWTDQQRASAIALAFGTQAQAGMNALIAAGGDELRHYTKEAQKAGGTTKEIADQLNNTKAANVARFRESIHVLSITFGEQLLPTLTPVIKKLTELMKQFANLNPEQQQNIVKWAALAAAVGPVSTILGKTFNVVKTGTLAFSHFATGMARGISVARTGGSAFTALKSIFSQNAYEAAGLANKSKLLSGSLAVAGTASRGLVSTLGSALPIFGGATLAVVALGAAWQIFGKNIRASQDSTSRWGIDVGENANRALQSVQHFNDNASGALNNFSNNAKNSATAIKDNFQNMFDEMAKYSQDTLKNAEKNIKNLPATVQEQLKQGLAQHKKNNDQILDNQKALNSEVNNIINKAYKEQRSLTANEEQRIRNIQARSNENQVNLLSVSEKKKLQILAAMNDDYSSMSEMQIQSRYTTLFNSIKKEEALYKKQRSQIKKLYDSGNIDKKTYQNSLNELAKNHKNFSDSLITSMYRAAEANNLSSVQIEGNFKSLGLSMGDVYAAVSRTTRHFENSGSKIADVGLGVSKSAKEAGIAWNNLVLDPKTGDIKTNAQEVLNQTAKTQQGWNSLKLIARNAKINSNAKEMLIEATLVSGRWNNMSWKDRRAFIKSNAAEEMIRALESNKTWDGLNYEQKKAVINAEGLTELADLIIKYGLWNKMPDSMKRILVEDSDAKSKLIQAGINLDNYNNKPNPTPKKLAADKTPLDRAIAGSYESFVQYDRRQLDTKEFYGDNSDILAKSAAGKEAIKNYNNAKTLIKNLLGNSLNVQKASATGRSSINLFNLLFPSLKHLRANDEASVNAKNAKNSVSNFLNLPNVITKTVRVVTSVAKAFGFEKGSKDFPINGLAMVNDQDGPNYQEAIMTPSGSLMFPQGRNVVLPIPKHSRIFTADETKQLFKIPKFAKGTLDFGSTVNTINRSREQIIKQPPTIINNSKSAPIIKQTINIEIKVEDNTKKDDARHIAEVVSNELKKQTFDKSIFSGGV